MANSAVNCARAGMSLVQPEILCNSSSSSSSSSGGGGGGVALFPSSKIQNLA